MKHAHNKYDRIQDPDNIIPEDEPVFLIRAQDDIGWMAVKFWSMLRTMIYGSDTKVVNIEKHAEKMKHWPVKKKAD